MMKIFLVQRQRNNQGFVILSTVFIVLFLSIILGASFMRSSMQLREAESRMLVQQSFYAADSGIDRAIFELRRDPQWRVEEGEPLRDTVRNMQDEAIGSYDVIVRDGGQWNSWQTTRVIRSVGTSAGWPGAQPVTRAITARVIVENPSRYLVSTLGDLRLDSGAVVNADMFSRDVYFDINKALASPEKEIRIVNGDVFYLRNKRGDADPDVLWEQGSEIIQSPSVTFAGVDAHRYGALAQTLAQQGEGYYHAPSDQVLDINLADLSSLNGGADFFPKLIFAEGDIRIRGEFAYPILVVSRGDIYIMGDVKPEARFDAPDIPLSERPQIGLFAAQDVIIPLGSVSGSDGTRDRTIEAFIMADGQGDSRGLLRPRVR